MSKKKYLHSSRDLIRQNSWLQNLIPEKKVFMVTKNKHYPINLFVNRPLQLFNRLLTKQGATSGYR